MHASFTKKIILLPVAFSLLLLGVVFSAPLHAQESAPQVVTEESETILYFFHSPTCPHCRKEQKFLDRMEEQYPGLDVRRHEAADPNYVGLMRSLAAEYGAERFLGNVPLTFVGEEYFVGYESDKDSGKEIEGAIRTALGLETEDRTPKANSFSVPILGAISAEDYSLPALAALLGFLDGFNVCSLGALILIIGLALRLQRRRAIILFGGTFLLTTALVYGALIVAWYHIFELFSASIGYMQVGVALLAIGGGLYFLKEYLRMRKQGALCEFSESPLIARITKHTGRAFEDNTRLMGVVGTVLIFAAVVAVVEFPCSAAVPVVFAGMLVEAGLSTASYLAHIGIFIFFYLLDEIIIFAIAAYRLKIWMTSGTFTKWAVLSEAVILILIGLWYLTTSLGVL